MVRKSNLIGRSREYKKQARAGKLPKGLEHLVNKVAWPIAHDTEDIHLACYFDEPHYTVPKRKDLHTGLDIQVPAGTPVYAPVDLTVLVCNIFPDIDKNMVDVHAFDPESGIIYSFMHLNKDSLSEEILQTTSFNRPDAPTTKAGETFAEVGTWTVWEIPEYIDIPKDVLKVYGRRYDHLHLGMRYVGENPWQLYQGTTFNPLKLLEKPTKRENQQHVNK